MKKRSTILGFTLLFQACVQEKRSVEITFNVEMSLEENVQSVDVIGEYDPLSWDKPLALSDPDGDRIYSATFTCAIPYHYMEYKFMKNGEEIELYNQNNRKVRVENLRKVEVHTIFNQPSK